MPDRTVQNGSYALLIIAYTHHTKAVSLLVRMKIGAVLPSRFVGQDDETSVDDADVAPWGTSLVELARENSG